MPKTRLKIIFFFLGVGFTARPLCATTASWAPFESQALILADCEFQKPLHPSPTIDLIEKAPVPTHELVAEPASSTFNDLLDADAIRFKQRPARVSEAWLQRHQEMKSADGHLVPVTSMEYRIAGQRFEKLWREDHPKDPIGFWNQIVFVTAFKVYSDPEGMRDAFERAEAFNQGSLESQIVGYWTAAILLAQHIQLQAPHPEEERDGRRVYVDSELLLTAARALISLSVAWKESHPHPYTEHERNFLVFVEYGLAAALDPALQDVRMDRKRWASFYQKSTVSEATPPTLIVKEMRQTLDRIPDTPLTTEGLKYNARSAGPFVSEEAIDALLTPVLLRSFQGWRDAGYNPPLIDWHRWDSDLDLLRFFKMAHPDHRYRALRETVLESQSIRHRAMQIVVFKTARPNLFPERLSDPSEMSMFGFLNPAKLFTLWRSFGLFRISSSRSTSVGQALSDPTRIAA